MNIQQAMNTVTMNDINEPNPEKRTQIYIERLQAAIENNTTLTEEEYPTELQDIYLEGFGLAKNIEIYDISE